MFCPKTKAMDVSSRHLIKFACKLNSGRWNPLRTTLAISFVMLIRTILILNPGCFDGERNDLNDIAARASFQPTLSYVAFLSSEGQIPYSLCSMKHWKCNFPVSPDNIASIL